MLRSGGGSTNFSKTVLSFLFKMATDANAVCLAESPDQTTNILQSMVMQFSWTSESHGSGRRYGDSRALTRASFSAIYSFVLPVSA